MMSLVHLHISLKNIQKVKLFYLMG